MTVSVGLILVGAGSSRRMGEVDKVWETLGGHPIVWHSLTRLGSVVRECVLVVRSDHLARAYELCAGLGRVHIVEGGQERQDSVRRGLEVIQGVDAVAVHDVARPFADARMLRAGVEALGRFDGVIPVVPFADTIKEVRNDEVVRTLDRSALRAVQTPQIFRVHVLREAHARAREKGVSGTDDAQLLELSGFRVGTYPGDQGNFKITTPADFLMARLLVERNGPI